jgi:Zn-dependent alcohol dehydrogenase
MTMPIATHAKATGSENIDLRGIAVDAVTEAIVFGEAWVVGCGVLVGAGAVVLGPAVTLSPVETEKLA